MDFPKRFCPACNILSSPDALKGGYPMRVLSSIVLLGLYSSDDVPRHRGKRPKRMKGILRRHLGARVAYSQDTNVPDDAPAASSNASQESPKTEIPGSIEAWRSMQINYNKAAESKREVPLVPSSRDRVYRGQFADSDRSAWGPKQWMRFANDLLPQQNARQYVHEYLDLVSDPLAADWVQATTGMVGLLTGPPHMRGHLSLEKLCGSIPLDRCTERTLLPVIMSIVAVLGSAADDQFELAAEAQGSLQRLVDLNERAEEWDGVNMIERHRMKIVKKGREADGYFKRAYSYLATMRAYWEAAKRLDPNYYGEPDIVRQMVYALSAECAADMHDPEDDGSAAFAHLRRFKAVLTAKNALIPTAYYNLLSNMYQRYDMVDDAYRLFRELQSGPLRQTVLQRDYAGLRNLPPVNTYHAGRLMIPTVDALEAGFEHTKVQLERHPDVLRERLFGVVLQTIYSTLLESEDPRANVVFRFADEKLSINIVNDLLDAQIQAWSTGAEDSRRHDVRGLLKRMALTRPYTGMSPKYIWALEGILSSDDNELELGCPTAFAIWGDIINLKRNGQPGPRVSLLNQLISTLADGVHTNEDNSVSLLCAQRALQAYREFREVCAGVKISHGVYRRLCAALCRVGMVSSSFAIYQEFIRDHPELVKYPRFGLQVVDTMLLWITDDIDLAMGSSVESLPRLKPRQLAVAASLFLHFGIPVSSWFMGQLDSLKRTPAALAQLSVRELDAVAEASELPISDTERALMQPLLDLKGAYVEELEAVANLQMWEWQTEPQLNQDRPLKKGSWDDIQARSEAGAQERAERAALLDEIITNAGDEDLVTNEEVMVDDSIQAMNGVAHEALLDEEVTNSHEEDAEEQSEALDFAVEAELEAMWKEWQDIGEQGGDLMARMDEQFRDLGLATSQEKLAHEDDSGLLQEAWQESPDWPDPRSRAFIQKPEEPEDADDSPEKHEAWAQYWCETFLSVNRGAVFGQVTDLVFGDDGCLELVEVIDDPDDPDFARAVNEEESSEGFLEEQDSSDDGGESAAEDALEVEDDSEDDIEDDNDSEDHEADPSADRRPAYLWDDGDEDRDAHLQEFEEDEYGMPVNDSSDEDELDGMEMFTGEEEYNDRSATPGGSYDDDDDDDDDDDEEDKVSAEASSDSSFDNLDPSDHNVEEEDRPVLTGPFHYGAYGEVIERIRDVDDVDLESNFVKHAHDSEPGRVCEELLFAPADPMQGVPYSVVLCTLQQPEDTIDDPFRDESAGVGDDDVEEAEVKPGPLEPDNEETEISLNPGQQGYLTSLRRRARGLELQRLFTDRPSHHPRSHRQAASPEESFPAAESESGDSTDDIDASEQT